MTQISKRAAYLRGLADGLGLDGKTPEQRVIREIIGLLEELSAAVDGGKQKLTALEEELSTLSEEVMDMQGDWYEEDDLGEAAELERALNAMISPQPETLLHCPNCGEVFPGDSDEEETGHPVTCPHCGQTFNRK